MGLEAVDKLALWRNGWRSIAGPMTQAIQWRSLSGRTDLALESLSEVALLVFAQLQRALVDGWEQNPIGAAVAPFVPEQGTMRSQG
jgi:hypothetical protein